MTTSTTSTKAPASRNTRKDVAGVKDEAAPVVTSGPKSPRNAAYTAAEKRLREAHPEEFTQYHREETARLGLTFVADERAKKAAEKEEARKARRARRWRRLQREYPEMFHDIDTTSSAARQHFIDTGEYPEREPDPNETGLYPV